MPHRAQEARLFWDASFRLRITADSAEAEADAIEDLKTIAHHAESANIRRKCLESVGIKEKLACGY